MDLGIAQYIVGICACLFAGICLIVVQLHQHYTSGQKINDVGLLFVGLILSIGLAYALALKVRLAMGEPHHGKMLQAWWFELRTIPVTAFVIALAWRVGLRVFNLIFRKKIN